MKAKHLLLLSCTLSIFLFVGCDSVGDSGDAIKWTSFDKIADKQGQKMIFIELYTPWCGWCRRMENVTFNDPTVAKYMNKNFYNIQFDAEDRRPIKFLGKNYRFDAADGSRGRHSLAKALMTDSEKQGYPTVVFLDENYNLIQAIPGYISAKDFEAIMRYFGDGHYKTTTWTDFVTKYGVKAQGNSNTDGTNAEPEGN